MISKSILETRRGRLTAFSLLYLSEGIPLGFSAIAMTTYLRMQGVGLAEIGAFTGSLYAPWGFKWAWAPLVDLIQFKRFGAKRTWIIIAQILMILTLGVLALFDFTQNIVLLTAILVVHNIFAATQDVAIDALAVRILPEKERGVANGFMFGGAYLGQAIGGSGALYVAKYLGFTATFPFVLGALALILVGVTLRIREPELHPEETARPAGISVWSAFSSRLRIFFADLYEGFFKSGRGPLVGVLFGLLPSGALALGLVLGSTIQVDLGMDEGQIANLTLITATIAAIGCVTGGWISDRVGHRKALGVWYVMTAIPTFYLAARVADVGLAGVTMALFYTVSVAYSFASGLTYGTRTAVYMGLTNPKVAATQFTGYMALQNLVYWYSSLWIGRVADSYGYARTLTVDGLLAFVPLLLLPFLIPSTRARQ